MIRFPRTLTSGNITQKDEDTMSKSPKMSLDTSPYTKYFGGVIQKMGLQATIYESSRFLHLGAKIPLPNQDGVLARVEISLWLSDDQACWVVREFMVTTANPFLVLQGSDLLKHYGKRPAYEKGDLSKPNAQHWTMTRAADFQALLTNYDQVARELGKPALFGH